MLNEKEYEVIIKTLVNKVNNLECDIMLKNYKIETLEKEVKKLKAEGDNKNE